MKISTKKIVIISKKNFFIVHCRDPAQTLPQSLLNDRKMSNMHFSGIQEVLRKRIHHAVSRQCA